MTSGDIHSTGVTSKTIKCYVSYTSYSKQISLHYRLLAFHLSSGLLRKGQNEEEFN